MVPNAKDEFLKYLSQFNTLEMTWAFNMLKDAAKEAKDKAELKSMQHAHYNRHEEAAKAEERIPFYMRLMLLANKWREAEMEHSAPLIVDAILNRNKTP